MITASEGACSGMAYSGGSALQAERSGAIGGWPAAVIIEILSHRGDSLLVESRASSPGWTG
jgi:hypothetical protein